MANSPGDTIAMKWNWLFVTALPIGGAISLIAFIALNYEFGADASASDMGLATLLGAALGGAITLI
jgi:hypothetical protein